MSFNIGLYKLPVFKITIAYIAGILMANACPLLFHFSQEILFLLVFSFLLGIAVIRKKTLFASIYLLSLFSICGGLNFYMQGLEYQPNHFSYGKDRGDNLLLLRVLDITTLEKSQRLLTQVKYAGPQVDSLRNTTGQLMVSITPPDSNLTTGDLLITTSKYYEQKNNTNPLVFDYKAYLANRSIYHTTRLDSSEYEIIKNKTKNIKIRAGLIRDHCIDILNQHLDGNNLAVAAAMVLGERKLITDELYTAFTDTGTVHVLAVSGLHVGIIAGIILFFLNRIKSQKRIIKYTKTCFLIAAIWGFALLTGLAPAVLRAAIMLSLVLMGSSLLRQVNTYNTLALAALIMLLYDPNLLFQAGFQFSFLAILGILYFHPAISRTFIFKTKLGSWPRDMISISISAQLLVSPLAVYYFHKLPLYFWFTGMIAIPLAVIILWLGILLIGSHTVSGMLLGGSCIAVELLGKALSGILSFFNTCIFTIQKIPYCSTEGLWLSKKSLVLIYLALLLLALFIKFKKMKFIIGAALLLVLQQGLHLTENHLQRIRNYVMVYDIYDQSLIDVFKDGYYTRINPGILNEKSVHYATNNHLLYNRVIEEVSIKDIGIDSIGGLYKLNNQLALIYPTKLSLNYTVKKEIDFVVFSSDYYLDIEKLIQNYEIKKIILDGTFSKKRAAKKKLKKEAKKYNIPIHDTSLDKALMIELL